jgi:hypothetical protein
MHQFLLGYLSIIYFFLNIYCALAQRFVIEKKKNCEERGNQKKEIFERMLFEYMS